MDEASERDPQRSLAVGLLSMVPLFAAYEWSRAAVEGRVRNAGEAVLGLPLRVFGEWGDEVRLGLLAVGALAAFVAVRLRGLALGRSLLRIPIEGAVAAIAMGPVLLVATRLFLGADAPVPLEAHDVAGRVRAAFVFGGAAYEEIVFRVGLFSLVYLIVRRLLFTADDERESPYWTAEIVAGALSAGAFACIHLSAVASVLDRGGEPFHPGLFAWRLSAGIFLVVLFRWRGVGVAAWCHGLFNAALVIGASPAVLD